MKIAVYSENNYGCGASIAAFRLAKGLSKNNHNVFYIFEQNKAKYDMFKDTKFDTWHLGESKSKVKNLIFKSLNCISRISRTNINREFLFKLFYYKMKKFNPDIIHLHNCYFTHSQISTLSEQFPVVWTMHDQFALFLYNYKIIKYDKEEKIYSPLPDWRLKYYNPDILLNNKKSKIIFTPPSRWLADLSNQIVRNRKEIKVIHNGINTEDFFPLETKKAKEILGIDKDKFTLLFLAGTGAWERKNSVVIFEALKLIPNLDIQVVAIGSVIKFKFNDKRVIKKGAIYSTKALRDVYSSADVFCIPSVVDNLPNTVLESLLCDTPVLGSHTGGIPEMIEVGKTGWLFNPYSAEDLADKIVKLYNNYNKIQNMKSVCRNSVIDKFSEKTMVKNYQNIYNQMINGEQE